MDSEELKLFNELKRLAKVANQRILTLERLTKRKQPFAVKELADLLYQAGGLNRLKVNKRKGKSVRASAKQGEYFEMLARKKALEKFINEETSTVSGVKKYKAKLEEDFDRKYTFAQASKKFQKQKIRDWALEHFTESELFGYYNDEFKGKSVDLDKFINDLKGYTTDELDVDKLQELYNYLRD